jgi:hypothetical protein
MKKKADKRGGPRPNSGRPPKVDKELYAQLSCALRRDTIERLRLGANSRYVGEFLQEHLDRYPPPHRLQYLSPKRHRNKREETYRETREDWEKRADQKEREERRLARMPAELRADEIRWNKAVEKVFEADRRKKAKEAKEAARAAAKANDGIRKAVPS